MCWIGADHHLCRQRFLQCGQLVGKSLLPTFCGIIMNHVVLRNSHGDEKRLLFRDCMEVSCEIVLFLVGGKVSPHWLA